METALSLYFSQLFYIDKMTDSLVIYARGGTRIDANDDNEIAVSLAYQVLATDCFEKFKKRPLCNFCFAEN